MRFIKKALILTSSLILLVILITALISACIISKLYIDNLLIDKNMPVTIINRQFNLNLPTDTQVLEFIAAPRFLSAELLLPQDIKINKLQHKLKKALPGDIKKVEDINIKNKNLIIESVYSAFLKKYYNGSECCHPLVYAYICKGTKDGRYYLYISQG